jgi:DnaJ-class molecular chaperone
MTSDPFEILGVVKTASDEEIKAAYRKKVQELHPDKNQDKDTSKEFAAVKEAFDTIETKQKRDKLMHPQTDEGVDISWLFKQQALQIQRMEELRKKHEQNLKSAIPITVKDLLSQKKLEDTVDGKVYSATLSPRWGANADYAKINLRSQDGVSIERYLHLNLENWNLHTITGDLETTIEIPYWDLVLGGKVNVSLPSGKAGAISLPATEDGFPPKILKVSGAGLQGVGAVGMTNGCAKFVVVPVFPPPSEEQKELLIKIKEINKNETK